VGRRISLCLPSPRLVDNCGQGVCLFNSPAEGGQIQRHLLTHEGVQRNRIWLSSSPMKRKASRWTTYFALPSLLLLFVLLIVSSPAALSFLASDDSARTLFGDTDWPLASTAGQAYGGISAVLAGVALLAVAVSLIYQARQTKVGQLQAVHSMQLELVALAYDNPDLMAGWTSGSGTSYAEWRKNTYLNLIFRYLRMDYELGNLSDKGLQRNMRNRFKSILGRTYWSEAKSAWEIASDNRRRRRFYEITETAFKESLSEPPEPTPTAPDDSEKDAGRIANGLPASRTAVTIAVGVSTGMVLGTLISELLNRTRKG
jgi:Family of unknown function (DUF6082)